MGLFDSLFGSSSKTTTNTNTSTVQNQTGQGTQTTAADNTSTQGQTQTQNSTSNTQSGTQTAQQTVGKTSTLDADVIGQLKDLLSGQVGKAKNAASSTDPSNSDALRGIANELVTRATGGNAATFDALTAADTAAAKLAFETGEGAQTKQIQQAIGSTKNTYSQLIEQKGQRDLATTIAQITAQDKVAALNADQNNLSSAISALAQASGAGATDAGSALAPVLAIVSALKGSETSTTEAQTGSSQTGTTSTEQTLADVISKIVGSSNSKTDTSQSGTVNSVTTGTESSKNNSTPGLLQSIFGLF